MQTVVPIPKKEKEKTQKIVICNVSCIKKVFKPIGKPNVNVKPNVNKTDTMHWCMKSMKSGFTRAQVPCLKNLDVLLPRIDTQK